ncbi:hypothetical protein BDZ89DRAFT_1131455 [Hymenopellis radicata]|nr:hypothetical protein BDZ89DRAFT_1131455 [Hymenopellis radicata]
MNELAASNRRDRRFRYINDFQKPSRKGKERDLLHRDSSRDPQPTDLDETLIALRGRNAAAIKPRDRPERPAQSERSPKLAPQPSSKPSQSLRWSNMSVQVIVSRPPQEADPDDFSRRLKILSSPSPRLAQQTAEDATSSRSGPTRDAAARQLFNHRKDDPVRFSVLARPQGRPIPQPRMSLLLSLPSPGLHTNGNSWIPVMLSLLLPRGLHSNLSPNVRGPSTPRRWRTNEDRSPSTAIIIIIINYTARLSLEEKLGLTRDYISRLGLTWNEVEYRMYEIPSRSEKAGGEAWHAGYPDETEGRPSAVDPVLLGVPTYFDVIPKKRARDLRLIRGKLDSDKYETIEALEEDMALMVDNAITFNGLQSDVGAGCCGVASHAAVEV